MVWRRHFPCGLLNLDQVWCFWPRAGVLPQPQLHAISPANPLAALMTCLWLESYPSPQGSANLKPAKHKGLRRLRSTNP